jgi:hypothetical protein
MKKYFCAVCLALLSAGSILSCSGDDGESGPVNCRIKEMYFVDPSYSFKFSYQSNGELKKISSPNVSQTFQFQDGRVNKVIIESTGSDDEILSYSYPKEGMATMTSSVPVNGMTRLYEIFYTGDQLDSVKLTDPANPNTGDPELKISWRYTYIEGNVSMITSVSPSYIDTIRNIQYDDGLNASSLLRQSTGLFSGGDILLFAPFGPRPEQLSFNNPATYDYDRYSKADDFKSKVTFHYSFEYEYPKAPSHPIELSNYVNANFSGTKYYFIYEGCD